MVREVWSTWSLAASKSARTRLISDRKARLRRHRASTPVASRDSPGGQAPASLDLKVDSCLASTLLDEFDEPQSRPRNLIDEVGSEIVNRTRGMVSASKAETAGGPNELQRTKLRVTNVESCR